GGACAICGDAQVIGGVRPCIVIEEVPDPSRDGEGRRGEEEAARAEGVPGGVAAPGYEADLRAGVEDRGELVGIAGEAELVVDEPEARAGRVGEEGVGVDRLREVRLICAGDDEYGRVVEVQ